MKDTTSPESTTRRVLFVDDEPEILAGFELALVDSPFSVFTAECGEVALEILESKDIEVLVSDERMVGMQGWELLARVRERCPDVVRIILSGHADLQSTVRAINEGGAYRLLEKPISTDKLIEVIQSALALRDTARAQQQSVSSFVRAEAYRVLSPIHPESSGRSTERSPGSAARYPAFGRSSGGAGEAPD